MFRIFLPDNPLFYALQRRTICGIFHQSRSLTEGARGSNGRGGSATALDDSIRHFAVFEA
ncbi:MAG: hypothetical protein DU429_04850 [Candidatus Tokpelaia sp.]|nr:MAG: hypothetical protein DU430_00840 [Candidatus Tokpelaia sp.]KAA6206954.1 MAG: hypothetical protein DU429_04850 [Candidatus Tokpelaia sp.]